MTLSFRRLLACALALPAALYAAPPPTPARKRP